MKGLLASKWQSQGSKAAESNSETQAFWLCSCSQPEAPVCTRGYLMPHFPQQECNSATLIPLFLTWDSAIHSSNKLKALAMCRTLARCQKGKDLHTWSPLSRWSQSDGEGAWPHLHWEVNDGDNTMDEAHRHCFAGEARHKRWRWSRVFFCFYEVLDQANLTYHGKSSGQSWPSEAGN